MNYTDAKLWPAPGIYLNIPAAQYHALDAVSSSKLKRFRNLPSTCLDAFTDTWESTLGSASHAYSIEGKEVFDAQYVVAPEFVPPADFAGKIWKATSAYKNQVAEFEARMIGTGRTILDAEQGAAVLGLDASLRSNPASRRFMEAESVGELSVIWVDAGTGMLCKARVDWLLDSIPTDYKTTGQIDRFYNQILNLNYATQGAFYSMGLIAHGVEVKTFCFLVGETSGTYRIRTGFLGGGENGREWLDFAIDDTARLVGLFKECTERNHWPNYRLPLHLYSLDQLQPFDLLEEWSCPRNMYAP
jgi:hypothetical protein